MFPIQINGIVSSRFEHRWCIGPIKKRWVRGGDPIIWIVHVPSLDSYPVINTIPQNPSKNWFRLPQLRIHLMISSFNSLLIHLLYILDHYTLMGVLQAHDEYSSLQSSRLNRACLSILGLGPAQCCHWSSALGACYTFSRQEAIFSLPFWQGTS